MRPTSAVLTRRGLPHTHACTGLSIHDIRARNSYIRGTNGTSNGLVPMLRCFNSTARYVDQGGGKRPGAFAMYLEPWHADVFEFLDLRKNTGSEENRCRLCASCESAREILDVACAPQLGA